MLVDQSPDGLEVLRGSSTYTYDGNWKVQAENGADGYHVTATHWNYAATTSRRGTGESTNDTKALDAGGWGKSGGGYWSFPHGHLCLWTWAANPQDRPLWDQLRRAQGDVRRGQGRVHGQGLTQPVPVPERLCDGPVLTQIRHFRPIAPDKTEVTIYCIAPKGESAEARAQPDPPVRGLLQRLRHGHPRRPRGVPLLPADLPGAKAAPWNDMSRGAQALAQRDPNEVAEALGMDGVISSGVKNEDEGLYPGPARLLARDHARRSGRRDRPLRSDDDHDLTQRPRTTITQQRDRAVPLPRGPLSRRPRVREVAGVLRRRRRVLDAVVDATTTCSVEDPQTEISLIYYPNKGGLEDRVFRIRTERSSGHLTAGTAHQPQHHQRGGHRAPR